MRPTIPHGCILGGFRGLTIQKPGKYCQTAGQIWNTFCTMQVNLGKDTCLTNWPHETSGGGGGGSILT